MWVRQARLKSERAHLHPTLPASMWTSASRMAELVACWPKLPGTPRGGRRLSEEDFEFRGGHARWPTQALRHTRAGEHDSLSV